MTVIVCLDNANGMMFNHRRQSRDANVVKDILKTINGASLLIAPYSEPLFSQAECSVSISDSQRIQSDHTKRRHTINQYIVIIVFDLAQIASQNGFTAHCGHKHHFHSRQLDVGREQIDIFLVMQNAASWVCMIFTDNPG